MKSLMIVAHGSKKEISNNEFKELVNEIREKNNNFEDIDAAFLEAASPSIQTVVKKQMQKNISTIYLYPYFLNSGKHVIIDLPNIIQELQIQYTNITFKLLENFGKSPKISNIILSDISNL